MPIKIFTYPGFPSDIGITKIDVPPKECAFFLDFQRPLEKLRWFGVPNKWIGPAIFFLVPVAHASERSGRLVIGIKRNEPYFMDIQRLWREHRSVVREMIVETEDDLRIIADFGTHFPEDC